MITELEDCIGGGTKSCAAHQLAEALDDGVTGTVGGGEHFELSAVPVPADVSGLRSLADDAPFVPNDFFVGSDQLERRAVRLLHRAKGDRLLVLEMERAGSDRAILDDLKAHHLGLAFQIIDDILETSEQYLVTAEVPGISRDDLDIRVHDGRLTISGVRRERTQSCEQYHRVERGHGSFSRTFHLPVPVDGEQVTADLRDGVLTVTCPKVADGAARRIEVS